MAKKNKTPKWLRTIQLNSWEAELLVSALVLYALFQVPDFLTEFHLRNFERGSQLHDFFGLLINSVQILKFGYIFHILVRGLWVASVGLSYVFPKGINTERLKFKGRFDKELASKKSLVNSVLKLEELSSLFYGISFLGFGIFLGVGTLLLTFTLLADAAGQALTTHSSLETFLFLALFIYMILIVLVLIDFLTNGLFRKIDWMASWFYPVAIIFRVITLSFLYRRSLLVLISNTKGWKSNLIPFIVVIACGGFIFLQGQKRTKRENRYLSSTQQMTIQNENFENLRDADDKTLMTIQSDIITGNVIRLFIDDLDSFGTYYEAGNSVAGTKWQNVDFDSTSIFLNRWLTVRIDSVEINNIQWFKTQHSSTLDFGFMTYLDIVDFRKGGHNLSVKIDTTHLSRVALNNYKNGAYHQLDLANIHFFYDK